jgi:hypothetical protein
MNTKIHKDKVRLRQSQRQVEILRGNKKWQKDKLTAVSVFSAAGAVPNGMSTPAPGDAAAGAPMAVGGGGRQPAALFGYSLVGIALELKGAPPCIPIVLGAGPLSSGARRRARLL